MILIYPHTLKQSEDNFKILERKKREEKNNQHLEKFRKQQNEKYFLNKHPEKQENIGEKKSLKDEYTQTRFIFKKNQETSCSPIKFETKENRDQIFESNVENNENYTPKRRLSAAFEANKTKRKNQKISLLDESYSPQNENIDIFKNIDEENKKKND